LSKDDKDYENPRNRRRDRGSYDKEKKSNKNKMKNDLREYIDNYNSGLYNEEIFDEED